MRLLLLALAVFPVLLVAEDGVKPAADAKAAEPKAEDGAADKKRQLTLEELKKFYADERNRITTDWVEEALAENLFNGFWKASYVPVLVERKVENGEDYYRFGFKYLTDAHPDAAALGLACYYGMSKATFDKRNDDLQKAGYVLMQMQVTAESDDDATPNYCGVWVRPAGPRKKK